MQTFVYNIVYNAECTLYELVCLVLAACFNWKFVFRAGLSHAGFQFNYVMTSVGLRQFNTELGLAGYKPA